MNLKRNPIDKLTEDLRKQLDRMKIKGAKAQVALEGDKVTILVAYNYPQPKRATVRDGPEDRCLSQARPPLTPPVGSNRQRETSFLTDTIGYPFSLATVDFVRV